MPNVDLIRHIRKRENGWVKVWTGGMKSDKTGFVIRQLEHEQYAKETVKAFKPSTDTRCSEDIIKTYGGKTFPAIAVPIASEILNHIHRLKKMNEEVTVIGIDEGNFFGRDLAEVVQKLKDERKMVYIAALNRYSSRKPFGSIGDLLAVADEIEMVYSACDVCGELGTESFRMTNVQSAIYVGRDEYMATCNRCYLVLEDVRNEIPNNVTECNALKELFITSALKRIHQDVLGLETASRT